jgi:long-subunit fatty acid transport protein
VFGLGVVHDLNYFMRKTQARTNIKYARYNIPTLRLDNYEWTVGINRALDEKWNLLVDAGVRYTDSSFTYAEFIPIPPFFANKYDTNQDWGGVGQLALTYKGLKNSGDIRINHDIMPASGQSGTTERTSFLFNLTTRLTYEFRCVLSGGYFINKSQAGQYSVQQIDEDSIWISPNLVYEYSKDVSLSFSYSYNKTYYHITSTDAERNVFQIRYKIQHDLFQ